ASLDNALDGRWAPTSTTGMSTLTVRLRKYAVSSSVAVPWPMTIPSRLGSSCTSLRQSWASSFQSVKLIAADDVAVADGDDIGHQGGVRPAGDQFIRVQHVSGSAVILHIER